MPAVRDYTFAYETTTTDGGITIPMCNFEAGDLLLVFAMADTGAGTWGCSGYTQLFARNNTCSAVCYWKIAGATEADVAVTNTVSETYNGCVIAIRDVNQTNPFGSPAVQTNTTQAAVARYAMDQITTSVADSLVIFAAFNSGTGVPSFIEGPVTGLLGADGSAESMGVGWMMKRATGLTPNNIFCSNVGTGAGVKATIQIAPPAAGASVIPPYCAADASTLLDYINGTTAYNGNTAIAATADTNFGTSLGGLTANDATLAASADVGINSFHSFARLTNAAAANTVSGAELVFAAANRPNAGSKNILAHVRPQTPGNYQRLAPISSNRGVWFGMRSNTASGGATTGYKIWQVHGVGTKWSLDATLPIVINNGAGNVRASSGTLDAGVLAALGFWTSSIGALTSGMEFGVAWLMGTCTVAGGNEVEPVGIPGIVNAAALGHERLSSIQQGAKQMLCVQNLQFGDGGTNRIYLDLDATAIEFPQQYSLDAGNVFYNSTDNVVGLTYYAGASDTIKHRNSVVSSASKYHWRIHASSSASATYDFSGLAIIGAGDVQLRPVTTFAAMSFNDCPTINKNGSDIVGCSITDSTIITPLSEVADIVDCSFASDSAYAPAMKISGVGSGSLIGGNFSGFDADNIVAPSSGFLLPLASAEELTTDYYQLSSPVLNPGTSGVLAYRAGVSKYYGGSLYLVGGATNGIGIDTGVVVGSSDFCLEGWFMRPSGESNTSEATLFSFDSGLHVRINTSNVLEFYNGSNFTPVSGALSFDVWYHVALVRSGGVCRLWLNGTTSSSTASKGAVAATAKLGPYAGLGASRSFYSCDLRLRVGAAHYTAAFTPPAALRKRTALHFLDTSGTVNLTVSGGNTPSYTTRGATVNILSGATVTFTGIPAGTDIVILSAGSTTVLHQVDQNAGSSYGWTYQGTPTVDVGFLKPGYVPFYIRGLSLGATDSSIPVSLTADRNYL